MKLIPLILLLTACGHFNRTEPASPLEDSDQVAEVLDGYLPLLADKYGGPVPPKCDSALFTALFVIAGGEADTTVFEDPQVPGLVYRSIEQDCFDNGESASQCSRDMYLGWTFERYLAGDVKALERVLKRATDEKLIMCRGDLSRTVMSPELLYTIHRAYRALGGTEGLPDPLPAPPAALDLTTLAFTDHLEAVHTWFKSVVEGGASPAALETFTDLARGHPQNALFVGLLRRYGDGDQARTHGLILDRCPVDRLPTTADHCEPYLWQRTYGVDWQPCPARVKPGHGVDCAIAAAVALGRVR